MKDRVAHSIKKALQSLIDEGVFMLSEMPQVTVTRPKDEQFGEYTSNIALVLGKQLGVPPRDIATRVGAMLMKQASREGADAMFAKVDVAGPGHINFVLSHAVLTHGLREIVRQGGHFGDLTIGAGQMIDNEIISANPTGPLHLGNARGGFYGDVISRVLRKAGYEVTNEYYVNDAGEQIEKLGHSVVKDREAVYGGAYIDALHDRLVGEHASMVTDVRAAGTWAARVILEEMIVPSVTETMGIAIDLWVSEKRDIVEASLVEHALEIFHTKGLSYEADGALWLRTTDFGDDKDRVLVKSDGQKTYFASDCGYILHKASRGFAKLILILGADHHGYRTRLEAAATALGFAGVYAISFVQLVRLVKDGQEVRMSKRAGNVVTIDDLLERVPVDVARFFFLMYSPDTHLNFDLGLAEERSAKNPVYSVQYAHARLASILRKAREVGITMDHADLSLLTHDKERALLREIIIFPEMIAEIAESYGVHALPQIALRLADKLHSFYDQCLVIDAHDRERSQARLMLVAGIKILLGETLRLMGITAPERMEHAPRDGADGDTTDAITTS